METEDYQANIARVDQRLSAVVSNGSDVSPVLGLVLDSDLDPDFDPLLFPI
jgi:hypothetical protein